MTEIVKLLMTSSHKGQPLIFQWLAAASIFSSRCYKYLTCLVREWQCSILVLPWETATCWAWVWASSQVVRAFLCFRRIVSRAYTALGCGLWFQGSCPCRPKAQQTIPSRLSCSQQLPYGCMWGLSGRAGTSSKHHTFGGWRVRGGRERVRVSG